MNVLTEPKLYKNEVNEIGKLPDIPFSIANIRI